MAGRRRVEQGRRRAEAEHASVVEAFLVLLVRALGLDRAAVELEESPGGRVVPVAACGEPEDPPAWSFTLPVRTRGRTIGQLLLYRRGEVPLAPADRGLAERLAEGVAQIADSERLGAELTRTRELLSRADRLSALGTLSAGVAHEIRNPLVSVRTFIQLLPERLADEEFRTGFRDLALGEIERICGLINDLLAFSRPAPAQREPTDMNELVAQITRLLDAEARKRDVSIACRADPTLPLVVVDDAQVKQVLMNVVLNAIQACAAHGTVEVATRISESGADRCCTVVVVDSGSGIAPEHVEQIFDPFFSTKEAGSGLGLFIARQIVSEHGGFITTAARPEGGTEFSIHFPLRARLADVDAG